MNKQIFITNGMARCGKDTFARFLNHIVPTMKYSSIDKVKEIATLCGWNGGKTEKDRKFLSDLKALTSEYSNMSFWAVKDKVDEFMSNDRHKIMLIDIREPSEIKKAQDFFAFFGVEVKTILIENTRVEFINSNDADANVYNYTYDYVVQNNGTFEDFVQNVNRFAKDIGVINV